MTIDIMKPINPIDTIMYDNDVVWCLFSLKISYQVENRIIENKYQKLIFYKKHTDS